MSKNGMFRELFSSFSDRKMNKESIAVAIATGNQVIRDKHAFFVKDGIDNSEHIPRTKIRNPKLEIRNKPKILVKNRNLKRACL